MYTGVRKNFLTDLFFSTTREKFLFKFLRLRKHTINKNTARAFLQCKRDYTTIYVNITQYAYTRDWKTTNTTYVDIIQSVHASSLDNSFHVYIN